MKIKVLLFVFVSIFALSGCDPYVGEKPYDYADSVWVCDNPKITYYVVGSIEDEDSYDYAISNIDGQEIELDFHFQASEIRIDKADSTDPFGVYTLGECTYSREKFIVTIAKEYDDLFNGKYETMVFNRVK